MNDPASSTILDVVIEHENKFGERSRNKVQPIALRFDHEDDEWKITAFDTGEGVIRYFPLCGSRLMTVEDAADEVIAEVRLAEPMILPPLPSLPTMDLRFHRVGTRTLLQQRFEVLVPSSASPGDFYCSEWRDVPGPEVGADAKSDAEFRVRVMEKIDQMNDLDRYAVLTASGLGLDAIGSHVGVYRDEEHRRTNKPFTMPKMSPELIDELKKDHEPAILKIEDELTSEQIGAIFKPSDPTEPPPKDVDYESWRTFRNSTNQWLAEVSTIKNKPMVLHRAIGYMQAALADTRPEAELQSIHLLENVSDAHREWLVEFARFNGSHTLSSLEYLFSRGGVVDAGSELRPTLKAKADEYRRAVANWFMSSGGQLAINALTFVAFNRAEPGDVCRADGAIKTQLPDGALSSGQIIIRRSQLDRAIAFGWKLVAEHDQDNDLVRVSRGDCDR